MPASAGWPASAGSACVGAMAVGRRRSCVPGRGRGFVAAAPPAWRLRRRARREVGPAGFGAYGAALAMAEDCHPLARLGSAGIIFVVQLDVVTDHVAGGTAPKADQLCVMCNRKWSDTSTLRHVTAISTGASILSSQSFKMIFSNSRFVVAYGSAAEIRRDARRGHRPSRFAVIWIPHRARRRGKSVELLVEEQSASPRPRSTLGPSGGVFPARRRQTAQGEDRGGVGRDCQ